MTRGPVFAAASFKTGSVGWEEKKEVYFKRTLERRSTTVGYDSWIDREKETEKGGGGRERERERLTEVWMLHGFFSR